MKPQDLINYKGLSLLLSGNDNSIRKNKCPKKYSEKINELKCLLEFWINKNK